MMMVGERCLWRSFLVLLLLAGTAVWPSDAPKVLQVCLFLLLRDRAVGLARWLLEFLCRYD